MMTYLRQAVIGRKRLTRQRLGLARVVYVGPGGNDASDGLTVATRKRTMQAANSVAQPGDAIHLLTPDEVFTLINGHEAERNAQAVYPLRG